MPKIYDLTGQRFGRLTVIKKAFSKRIGSSKRIHWECICDCGKTAFVITSYLIGGHTKSCGCYRSKWCVENKTIHGMAHTPEHSTWSRMKRRCRDIKNPDYKDYGGRGIKVCDRWLESFQNFYDDMGPRPSKDHSIDRIDNDGDYTPENCRWATLKEQANNKRTNVLIEIDGVEKTLKQWCTIYGIRYETVQSRIATGWEESTAVRTSADFNRDMITFRGITKNLRQWAIDLNIGRTTLHCRLYRYGWTVEKAFTTPVGAHHKNITIDNETKNLKQWTDLYNISYDLVKNRLRNGWDAKKALTTAPIGEKIVIGGVSKSIKQWSDFYGIKCATVRRRLRHGMDIHKALTTPVKSHRKK